MQVLQAPGDGQAPVPTKRGATAGGPPDPSSALLHSLRSWRDASRAAATAAATPASTVPPSRRGTATGGAASGAAAPAGGRAVGQGEGGVEPLTLNGFRIILGPDLRVAWFPFLQISLASPQLLLSGPAVPERLQVTFLFVCTTILLFSDFFLLSRFHNIWCLLLA